MAGLILLAVLAGWSLLVYCAVRFATRNIPNQHKQKLLRIIFVPIVFLLPVTDEIIGQLQFRMMCSNEEIFIDEVNAKNTDIYLAGVSRTPKKGALQFMKETWTYSDAKTHNVLISWSVIRSKGGWLSRFIGFPEGNPPYTFNGSCSPDGSIDFEKLNLNKVQRDSVIGRK